MMRENAKAMVFPWRIYATALLVGAAISLFGANWARSENVQPQAQASAPMVQMPVWAQGFVCHAKPGGWCDLRDWRGFGQAPAPQQAVAPAR